MKDKKHGIHNDEIRNIYHYYKYSSFGIDDNIFWEKKITIYNFVVHVLKVIVHFIEIKKIRGIVRRWKKNIHDRCLTTFH
jgi:hypothetical protein